MSDSFEYILRELIDRLQADPAVNVDLSDLQSRFTEPLSPNAVTENLPSPFEIP